MNDQLLSLELAAALKAIPDLAALFTLAPTEEVPSPLPSIHGNLTGEATDRPSLNISGEFEPYSNRRKGVVAFEILSRIGEQTEELEHHARFDALYERLLGRPGSDSDGTLVNRIAAINAIRFALSARGKVSVITYGPAREGAVEASVDGEDLRTVLRLNIAWAFIPQS